MNPKSGLAVTTFSLIFYYQISNNPSCVVISKYSNIPQSGMKTIKIVLNDRENCRSLHGGGKDKLADST